MFSYFIKLAEKVALDDTIAAASNSEILQSHIIYDLELDIKNNTGKYADFLFNTELLTYDKNNIKTYIQNKYIENEPITLDRVWNVCVRYLEGSRTVGTGSWWQYDPFYYHYRAPVTININTNNSSNEKDKDNDNDLNVIALIYLSVLMFIWFSNGIAFKRGVAWGVQTGSSLFSSLFSAVSEFFGGMLGGSLGVLFGIFNKFRNPNAPFFASVKTGLDIGRKFSAAFAGSIGSVFGGVLGFFSGMVVGFTAACAIGMTTAIAGTLKFARFLGFGTLFSYLNPFNWGKNIANSIETINQTYENNLNNSATQNSLLSEESSVNSIPDSNEVLGRVVVAEEEQGSKPVIFTNPNSDEKIPIAEVVNDSLDTNDNLNSNNAYSTNNINRHRSESSSKCVIL